MHPSLSSAFVLCGERTPPTLRVSALRFPPRKKRLRPKPCARRLCSRPYRFPILGGGRHRSTRFFLFFWTIFKATESDTPKFWEMYSASSCSVMGNPFRVGTEGGLNSRRIFRSPRFRHFKTSWMRSSGNRSPRVMTRVCMSSGQNRVAPGQASAAPARGPPKPQVTCCAFPSQLPGFSHHLNRQWRGPADYGRLDVHDMFP